MADGKDRACDVIQVSGRYVFAALGVPDDGLIHVAGTREYVLYVFANHRKAAEKATEICRLLAPTEAQVDALVPFGVWVKLGTGASPATTPYPHKVSLSSEAGFAHDPLRVFEATMAIVEAGDWHSLPQERRTVEREEDDEHRLRQRSPSRYRQDLAGKYRSLPGKIGKNEHGVRCEPNRTWVIEHTRGENKPPKPVTLGRGRGNGGRGGALPRA